MGINQEKNIDEIIGKFSQSYSERILGFGKDQLIALLPGGKLYTEYIKEFKENRDIQQSLVYLASAIKEFSGDKQNDQEIRVLKSNLYDYLDTFERVFSQYYKETNKIYYETLSVLKLLNPPESSEYPTIFLISGPSASGKDSLIRSALISLRERGYHFESAPKYTTRPPRRGEDHIDTNYYEFLSDKEFSDKAKEGEILFEYSKYHNKYGFSKKSLDNIKINKISMYCIISDYQRFKYVINDIRKESIRVLSILIWAPYSSCERRMYQRSLTTTDIKRRLIGAKADCKYIKKNMTEILNNYHLVINNGDEINFNNSSKELYQYIYQNISIGDWK